jgi:predicted nucleic acid-binding Zn ribbon protein
MMVPMAKDPYQSHLDGLRERRNRKDPDLSLSFLAGQFKREVQKPFEQLGKLTEIWSELVPADLASHTRLEGLNRGVLRVSVDSSGRLYELDRLLRGGVLDELITRHKGKALRRVDLKVAGHQDIT